MKRRRDEGDEEDVGIPAAWDMERKKSSLHEDADVIRCEVGFFS